MHMHVCTHCLAVEILSVSMSDICTVTERICTVTERNTIVICQYVNSTLCDNVLSFLNPYFMVLSLATHLKQVC